MNKRSIKSSSICRKFTAIFLSITLVFCNSAGYASQTLSSVTVKAEAISIPQELGKIEESFSGTSDKTIIYIQDAHDSLEAQENIAKAIHYLVDKYGVTTVYEEGYEGPVPTDKYFGTIQDSKIREKVAYFLMDKLRLGGAEYAHITRTKDFQLIGADNLKLHKKNIEKYRESAKHRKETEKDLAGMDAAIRKLALQYFDRNLKEWMEIKERFDRQEIDLLDYLKRTLSLRGRPTDGLPEAISDYPVISLLLSSEKSSDPALLDKAKSIDVKTLFEEINQLEDDYAKAHLKEARDREIFHYYKLIQLLKRLNAIEVTEEEYEAVKQNLKEMDTTKIAKFLVVQSHKSVVLSKTWEAHIQSAIEFYEVARERDASIRGCLEEYRKNDNKEPVVLVYGGFHKGSIKELLKESGLSYSVVMPKITSISVKHHKYYKQLMRIGYNSIALPILVAKATRPPNALAVVAVLGFKSEAYFIDQIDWLAREVKIGRTIREIDLDLRIPNKRSEARSQANEYQRLYDVWLGGIEYRNELIYEARKLGFEGLTIQKFERRPLRGDLTPHYDAPLSIKFMSLYSIYFNGIEGNIFQHAGGEGLYLWRETHEGYELLMFDWGPGVLNSAGNPVEDLRGIFGSKSYRNRAPGPGGIYRGGGEGLGLNFAAAETYLTRIGSINHGVAQIVDKGPGFIRTFEPHQAAAQINLKLEDSFKNASGFFVHGFVPFDKSRYRGSFSPISKENILGQIDTASTAEASRGSWQKRPAAGLESLRPGDDVRFTFYRIGEQRVKSWKEGILKTLPNFQNVNFEFQDGVKVNANELKAARFQGKENNKLAGGLDTLDLIRAWGLKSGDKIAIQYEEDKIVDERRDHRGILKEIPTPGNQGVFIFDDGLELSYARVKDFEIFEHDKPLGKKRKDRVTSNVIDKSGTHTGDLFDRLALGNFGFKSSNKASFKETEFIEDLELIHSSHAMFADLSRRWNNFVFSFYAKDHLQIRFEYIEDESVRIEISRKSEDGYQKQAGVKIQPSDFFGFTVQGNKEKLKIHLKIRELPSDFQPFIKKSKIIFEADDGKHKFIIETPSRSEVRANEGTSDKGRTSRFRYLIPISIAVGVLGLGIGFYVYFSGTDEKPEEKKQPDIPVVIKKIDEPVAQNIPQELMEKLKSGEENKIISALKDLAFNEDKKIVVNLKFLEPYLQSKEPRIVEAGLGVIYFKKIPIPFAVLEPYLKNQDSSIINRSLHIISDQKLPVTFEMMQPYFNPENDDLAEASLNVIRSHDFAISRGDLAPYLKSKNEQVIRQALQLAVIKKVPLTLELLKPHFNAKDSATIHWVLETISSQHIPISFEQSKEFLKNRKDQHSVTAVLKIMEDQKMPISLELLRPYFGNEDHRLVSSVVSILERQKIRPAEKDLEVLLTNKDKILVVAPMLRYIAKENISVNGKRLQPFLKIRPEKDRLSLDQREVLAAVFQIMELQLIPDLPLTLETFSSFLSLEEPDLRLSIFRILETQRVPVRFEQLSPYLRDTEGYMMDAVLSMVERRRIPVSLEQLRPYLTTFKTDKKSIAELNIFEMVKISNDLGPGFERLFYDSLVAKVQNEHLTRKHLEPIQTPLLHFIDLYQRHWKELAPQAQIELARKAAEVILEQRQKRIEKGATIFGPDRTVIIAANAEERFDVKEMRKLLKRFGVVQVEEFKGKTDLKENRTVKEQYLERIKELSKAGKPATIWESGHGGRNHFWFTDGQLGMEFSNVLRDPRAVSFREYSEALVAGQAGKKEIDLGHLVFIKDACLQCDVAERILILDIFQLAIANNQRIKSLPYIVTASSRGRVAYGNQLLDGMRNLKVEEGKPLLLKDVFKMDQEMSEKPPFYQNPSIFVPINPDDIRKKLGFPKDELIHPFLEIGRRSPGISPHEELLARNSKAVIFVDGSVSSEHAKERAEELAVLAASNTKQRIVVYNSDKAIGENNTARSELRELLGSFDLQNIKFVRGPLSQAIRPYQYRPNIDLVHYSADDQQAALIKKELGSNADRLIRFAGEPGALGYGLKHLQAVKLDKPVEDIQSKNGYHLVAPRASQSMRLLQEAQFVTVFASAA